MTRRSVEHNVVGLCCSRRDEYTSTDCIIKRKQTDIFEYNKDLSGDISLEIKSWVINVVTTWTRSLSFLRKLWQSGLCTTKSSSPYQKPWPQSSRMLRTEQRVQAGSLQTRLRSPVQWKGKGRSSAKLLWGTSASVLIKWNATSDFRVFKKTGTHSVRNKKKKTKIYYSIYKYSVIFQQNNELSFFDLQQKCLVRPGISKMKKKTKPWLP